MVSQLDELRTKYTAIFNTELKSELLKRACKKMYKDDIIALKEALIVIMPALDLSSTDSPRNFSRNEDEMPSKDTHFCKNTHRLVKRFK